MREKNGMRPDDPGRLKEEDLNKSLEIGLEKFLENQGEIIYFFLAFELYVKKKKPNQKKKKEDYKTIAEFYDENI